MSIMTLISVGEREETAHWDPNDKEQVAAAKAVFDQIAPGRLAVKKGSNGKGGEQIRQFDPQAEEIVVSDPLVGG